MELPLPLNPSSENLVALGSGSCAPAQAGRGYPNEGETVAAQVGSAEATECPSPRLVTRGESCDSPHPEAGGERYRFVIGRGGKPQLEITPLPREGITPFAALTDWLSVTFPFQDDSFSAIPDLLAGIHRGLTPKLGGLTDRNKGIHGYKRSFAFDQGEALLAFGGQRGTAFLSLPGFACAMVADWQAAHDFLSSINARITRWDGAVDDFDGSHSVDVALSWYLAGKFGTGGNKPLMEQMGNWAEPDGRGRTLYIGNCKNGKMLRVYEKGKQLGDNQSPWTRWELQLGNKGRNVPLDVLINPGPYVAGAYACLSWVNEKACRVRTISKTAQISYADLTHWLKTSYGRMLGVMLEVEGSAEAVLQKLVVNGFPKRLLMPDIDLSAGDE